MKILVRINILLLLFLFIGIDLGSGRSTPYLEDSDTEELKDEDISFLEQPSACNLEIAVMIGALYVNSSPSKDPHEIRALVNEYSNYLNANSDVIRCMSRLGNLFVQQGYSQFRFTNEDENRIRGSVYDMAAGSGLDGMDIADNITGSMRSDALQPVIIGQELLWLAEVIPYAAEDNWYRYENTGTYFRQQAIAQITQINAAIELYGAFDPEILAIMDAIMPQVNQWVDEYGMWYIISSGIYLGVFQ